MTMPYFERDLLPDYKPDFIPDFKPYFKPDFMPYSKPYFKSDFYRDIDGDLIRNFHEYVETFSDTLC